MRICPNCNKVFYVVDKKHSDTCTHCDYNLLDKRFRKRVPVDIGFSFSFDNKKIPARITDYSDNGIRIVYKRTTIPIDTIINLNIKKIKIQKKAKTIWTQKITSLKTVAGLQLI